MGVDISEEGESETGHVDGSDAGIYDRVTAAEYLNMSPRHLGILRRARLIPARRIGRQVVFERADLDAYLQSTRISITYQHFARLLRDRRRRLRTCREHAVRWALLQIGRIRSRTPAIRPEIVIFVPSALFIGSLLLKHLFPRQPAAAAIEPPQSREPAPEMTSPPSKTFHGASGKLSLRTFPAAVVRLQSGQEIITPARVPISLPLGMHRIIVQPADQRLQSQIFVVPVLPAPEVTELCIDLEKSEWHVKR